MAKFLTFKCDQCGVIKEVELSMDSYLLPCPRGWKYLEEYNKDKAIIKIFHNRDCIVTYINK